MGDCCFCCCDLSKGLEISNRFFAPEECCRTSDSEKAFYKSSPTLARLKWVVINTVLGLLKTIVFPLWALVGAVVFPILGAIRAYQGKESAGLLGAWAFSLLGLIGSACFVMVPVFYLYYPLPLIVSAFTLMSAISVSITIHVWRACEDPNPPEITYEPIVTP